ncbi:MAG: hypothetical protein ABL921_33425 [Pirellula sp.]
MNELSTQHFRIPSSHACDNSESVSESIRFSGPCTIPFRLITALVVATLLIANEGIAVSEDQKLGATGSLSDPKKDLIFDIGSHPVGKVLSLELKIQNESGNHLDLKMHSTCGCTTLEPKQINVRPGGAFDLKGSLKMPSTAQVLQIGIICQDVDFGVNYRIILSGVAKDLVRLEPSKLTVPSNSTKNYRMRFVSNFESVGISLVQSLSEDVCSISKVEGNEFSLALKPRVDLGQVEENVVLNLVCKDGKEVLVTLPIEYTDVVRLSPSIVSLRNTSGQLLQAVVLVNGVTNLTKDSLTLVIRKDGNGDNDGKPLVMNVVEVKQRSDRVFVVVASIEKTTLDAFLPQNDRKAWLQLSGKQQEAKWSCETKLSLWEK